MTERPNKLLILSAYLIVYIVWGSTYFFIQQAVDEIPPTLIGGIRFIAAGLLMLGWTALKKEKLFDPTTIFRAFIGGTLLLFIGNGLVIYTEQSVPSAVVAIVVSATPIWFILFDRKAWPQNLKNPLALVGTAVGLFGVFLLLGNQIPSRFDDIQISTTTILLLFLAPISWTLGSTYSKYYPGKASVSVTSAWQMLAGGVLFLLSSFADPANEHFSYTSVSANAWFALLYLIVFGSVIGYSAYVWLLQVEPTSRASTYAYVNPVVAVMLGVFIGEESIGFPQIMGLAIILSSVVLINLRYLPGRKRLR